jgi:hypothetical protein
MTDVSRDERGLTLVEVVIALFILTIIMGALAIVTITSFKATASSFTQLNNSHDRQLLEVYFPRDVLSANHATVIDAATLESGGGPNPRLTVLCQNAPLGIVSTNTTVLQLTWQGLPPQSTGTNQASEYFAVDYAVVPAPGSTTKYELERFYCHSTTAPSAAMAHSYGELDPDTVVAFGLAAPTGTTYPAYAQCMVGASGTDCAGSLTLNVTDTSDRAFKIAGEMRSGT